MPLPNAAIVIQPVIGAYRLMTLLERIMDAQERNHLLASIVARAADYRQGEIPPIDEEQVMVWLLQFGQEDRPIILREIERLLRKTYISRQASKTFITNLATNGELTGNAPKAFWETAGLLRLQTSSQSQNDMLALLEEILQEQFGFGAGQEESANRTYVYLDDLSCSGNQIKNDLLRWAEEHEIQNATIHIIVMVLYRGGEYFAGKNLSERLKERNITWKFWASRRLENRRRYAHDAEVFWPTQLPNDEHVDRWRLTLGENNGWFSARPPGGKGSSELFSSEEARDIVEQAFLRGGAYIYSLPQNPAQSMRPLGYSRLRSPGFGSTVITYRNCPNNAPLVLWWGDPNGGAPLNEWIPLLQRRPRAYDAGADFNVWEF
jgi:hypothetical protein